MMARTSRRTMTMIAMTMLPDMLAVSGGRVFGPGGLGLRSFDLWNEWSG
jgi:hypothetical protein